MNGIDPHQGGIPARIEDIGFITSVSSDEHSLSGLDDAAKASKPHTAP
jgi:hypothetical protein